MVTPLQPRRQREFLYVPQNETEEALSLGAVWVTGDARLVQPRPLPMGVTPEAFERWKTPEAKYAWVLETMHLVLGELEDPRGRRRRGSDTQASIRAEKEANRVYLYVPAEDGDTARRLPGVKWDRRHKMFYAESGADLSRCFAWLTPSAQMTWMAEREATRMLDHLVRRQAREEKARRDSQSNDEGAIQSGRDQSAIRD